MRWIASLAIFWNIESDFFQTKNFWYSKKNWMRIREAKIGDIKQIQFVRNSVRENTLSDPKLVTDQDCEEFISKRGKGCKSASAIRRGRSTSH